MKTRESVNARLSFFVFLKATFTKTAIKQKFVDGFSLKDFSAAIDQYTMKSPNFVSIEKIFELSNAGPKSSKYRSDVKYLTKFFALGPPIV